MTQAKNPKATSKAAVGNKPLSARARSAQLTRDSVLKAAIKVFAKYGLNGGSIEKISSAAKSHDRMIYYYFGNKEGLFVAVLEETYRRFNEAEAKVEIDPKDPVLSLKKLVEFIVNYYHDHPEFVIILNSENLHRGKHIAKSELAQEYSSKAISVFSEVLLAGQKKGVFRDDLSPRDLYMMVAAMGYFYQSNRYTLSAFLGEKLEKTETFSAWEQFVMDAVLRTVTTK
ncbi:TetR family transcriptional regulator [Orrella daihaiensis]|uniref:TetR family transcriptional regulator n=1 Tax=Orrella daihaiensis TaxID=2782176 RepID=A0ABY4AIY9_9BURK|nr:TetR family transcriptional regulator [Orrella daihaiensis]UOD50139.1 TetR family transcriptional regulator [Orrella daihaiensis]